MSTFSRELECVQEKAELLQEKLASLEEQHARQTEELEKFRHSKSNLEDMFLAKWHNLEREKQQVGGVFIFSCYQYSICKQIIVNIYIIFVFAYDNSFQKLN